MAATIAAVAAIGASAASAANSASQIANRAGAANQAAPKIRGLTPSQRLFNERTQNILDQEQALIGNAAGQAGAANAEIYKKLGYEPQYNGPAPDYAALKADQDQTYSDAVTAYVNWQAAKKKAGGNLNNPKVKAASAVLTNAREVANAKAGAYQAALANPRQIIGLNRLPNNADGAPAGHDPSNPDDLMQVALDLQNQTLIRALKGEEPIDSTLLHSFDVAETAMNDKLRRQLGPDYATSTAGEAALADFSRQKADAVSSYNRQTIDLFSKMSQGTATTLGNLTTQQISNLMTPSKTTLAIASSLGQSADDRTKYIVAQMNWRAQEATAAIQGYGAQTNRLAYGLDATNQQNQYIQSLANGVNSAAPAASNLISQYLGNSTNPSGTYDPNGPNLPGATSSGTSSYGPYAPANGGYQGATNMDPYGIGG